MRTESRGTDLLLGIDVGGTAVKTALFATDGTMRGLYSEAVPVHSPSTGWAEIDPDDWRRAICVGVADVLRQAGERSRAVAGIGLSNMIGTVAPLGRDGRALRRAIAYFDARSAAEAEWMLQTAPEIAHLTANRVTSGNTSLASVLWLRHHEPEVYRESALFAQTGTLIYRWLTGKTRVDWTNASFMGLFDYRKREWSAALASALGIDLTRLAPISAPDDVAGLLAQ